MYDAHFDLLTILYVLNNNKKYIEKLKKNLNDNLIGLNANLYFMSRKEMMEELNLNENIDVVKMFEKSVKLIESLNLKSKVIYSIEGCDYIKSVEELEYLNTLGLKAILLVWNNENKYGSGIRSDKGLTEKGKLFIQKAIDLDIAIDLSHANEKTFYGIVDVIKKSNKKVICYASHSNIYEIQNNPRNLKIKQLKALKEIGGYLGLVMHPPFITDSKDDNVIKKDFLKHIKIASQIMGVDRIMLASDNLEFYDELNVESPDSPFKQSSIKESLKQLLKEYFTEEEIDKIMYKNALKIYEKINSER